MPLARKDGGTRFKTDSRFDGRGKGGRRKNKPEKVVGVLHDCGAVFKLDEDRVVVVGVGEWPEQGARKSDQDLIFRRATAGWMAMNPPSAAKPRS